MHLPFLSRRRLAFLPALLLFFSANWSQAQTGPALLVRPWPEKNEAVEGRADATFFNAGHTQKEDSRFRLSTYESVGRFRIIPGSEISPRIGYDFTFLDMHTNSAKIPNQLSDESIAVGTGLFKNGNWIGAMTLGIGYAGDTAFANGSAWYGKADLILVNQINETDYLGFVLDYDGHRIYAPDLPLPGFGYSHRFDPKLQVVLGFPYTSVDWKPIDRLDINVEWALLTDFRVNVGYEFIKRWTAYSMFDYTRDSFRVSGLGKDRRLLYFQQRVEAGIRFRPLKPVTFDLGVGYGFSGEFERGFDYRNSHRVVKFSDEPYLRAGLELRF